jgi:hypothetical protein
LPRKTLSQDFCPQKNLKQVVYIGFFIHLRGAFFNNLGKIFKVLKNNIPYDITLLITQKISKAIRYALTTPHG